MDIAVRIKEITDKEKDLAQTAIAFCLAYDALSTVIPGNSSITQLESNLKSSEAPMSKALVEKLEDFYQNEVKQLNLPW